jgi:hypothetical protein
LQTGGEVRCFTDNGLLLRPTEFPTVSSK